MKIAIATDDRINIAKHTGRAVEFAIFEIENGTVVNSQFLKNDHTHHDIITSIMNINKVMNMAVKITIIMIQTALMPI